MSVEQQAKEQILTDRDLGELIKCYSVNPSLLFCSQVVACLKQLQGLRGFVDGIAEYQRYGSDDEDEMGVLRDIENDAKKLHAEYQR